MKKIYLLILLISCSAVQAQDLKLPIDTTVSTQHTTTINGKTIKYTAITGTLPVRNAKGEVMAGLHYTYYRKEDGGDFAKRPLLFSFNGGPGSASCWMHLAYTGPKVLNIDSEGNPVQPYGYKTNPHSVLDVTDIVYVNPVHTGYSRAAAKDFKKEDFFGINADVKYLAAWMTTFVTRYDRWLSPKYLIGESYGGTRVAGLAGELQSSQWMYLNGVIMVSPADYLIYSADSPLSAALNLPYYAAAAWYHKMLPADLQNKTLEEVLPEVEEYTIKHYAPAITRGGFISSSEKDAVAAMVSRYSGLSKDFVLKNNLDIPTNFFWKELLRDKEGMTIGRLDSRYLGIDRSDAGESTDYNPEITSWLHSFTPAINSYMRNELNFKTEVPYWVFGPVNPWDRSNNRTREQLREAMATNPYLKVMFQAGYFDGATNYFQSKYTMWQIDPSGKMKDRFSFKGYHSGHMMYLRAEDLKKANDDIRDFITNSTYTGQSAEYKKKN